jgi:chitinase
VVIAIPSNHQTYTLQHTTLSDLHLSNIVGKDASAISEWTAVLGSAPVAPAPPEPPVAPPITPPVVPPDSSAAPWSASIIYTAGMTATENGVTYKANWWTQGADPAHNNGVFGTGQPWTIVATVDASHGVPTVPTGLAAAGTSGSATTLTWNASSVPGNGVVTGYAIFEDGHQIASISGTTYTAANLAADTTYTFAVAALDAAASSAETSPISVHTTPAPQPPVVPPDNGAAAWSASSVYTAGMTATENGVTYKTNWWTQGNDPAHNNGVVGTGQPWTIVATADMSHNVPTVPAGLAAAATSSSAAILTWNASSVPGNGVVTGYAIFEDGHQIASVAGTIYTAANLAADTTYAFAVAALDAAGSSAETSPISVHTAPTSPTGPVTPGSAVHEFSPYIDMAMPADANLSAIAAASGIHNFTLAFVLSSGSGIGWQGVGAIDDDTLANGTTILSQVQAIQAAAISFGGAAGQEAALTATSAASLQAEYQSVIDRYHVHSLDFDIEGAAVQDQRSITLRDQALVGLEAANPGLTISYTLPVLPTGLTADGLNVLASAKHDGLKVDVVNIMAMDYGASVDNGGQMGLDAINAAIATEKQISGLGLTSKIGITQMIGVNDISSEVFTLADAQALVNYAQTDANIARLAMWSVARDNGNSAGAHYASPDSSGIAQQPYAFAAIFHQFDLGTVATSGAMATSNAGNPSSAGDGAAPQLANLIQGMAGLSSSAASQSVPTLSASATALDSSSQPPSLTTPHSPA